MQRTMLVTLETDQSEDEVIEMIKSAILTHPEAGEHVGSVIVEEVKEVRSD